jgi:hypothetical protein
VFKVISAISQIVTSTADDLLIYICILHIAALIATFQTMSKTTAVTTKPRTLMTVIPFTVCLWNFEWLLKFRLRPVSITEWRFPKAIRKCFRDHVYAFWHIDRKPRMYNLMTNNLCHVYVHRYSQTPLAVLMGNLALFVSVQKRMNERTNRSRKTYNSAWSNWAV